MKKEEKKLFEELCSFKSKTFDKSLLEAATPTVLGYLFFNRMQGVAYGRLKKQNLLNEVNREFRNSLKAAYDQNIKKNKAYSLCVKHISEILSECNCKYAMLKGAYLFKCYPEGYRTSNDIDLLVHPQNVTEIGQILLKNGFKQGSIKNGMFIPATRMEIIQSKMMRGETVPFIKEMNLPEMQFLEVDINFSLDYKPSETDLIVEMLKDSVVEKIGDLKIRTLNKENFFVHLCNHLYKEATTLPWVTMNRDMTLYKYCDIYMLLNDISKEDVELLFKYAKKIDMEKICAFAVIQASKLFKFENVHAIDIAESVLEHDPEFIHTVISPSDKKKYVFFEKDISKRFFNNERIKLLKEGGYNEKT